MPLPVFALVVEWSTSTGKACDPAHDQQDELSVHPYEISNVSSYDQKVVIALVGIQIRLHALVRKSEHVYVRDETLSGMPQ